jgi:L-fucose mutarotase
MLRGISPYISPELLSVMYRMGHGDKLIIADAHFPGESSNKNIIRADGLSIDNLLCGIMPLFVLDTYVDNPVMMMQVVPGDTTDPAIEKGYRAIIEKTYSGVPPTTYLERFAFYEYTRTAFAVVMSGDTRKYANVILQKGVTPVT